MADSSLVGELGVGVRVTAVCGGYGRQQFGW